MPPRRWMRAESESEVTDQSSDGLSDDMFDGLTLDSSGSGLLVPSESEELEEVPDHQHYGTGPSSYYYQREMSESEPEEDPMEDPEEESQGPDVHIQDQEIIVIPDSPESLAVPLIPDSPEVIEISSDSEMSLQEDSPIRMPSGIPTPQSQSATPDQTVPEIVPPSNVDPYPHFTEYWERYQNEVRQSESHRHWLNMPRLPTEDAQRTVREGTPLGNDSYGARTVPRTQRDFPEVFTTPNGSSQGQYQYRAHRIGESREDSPTSLWRETASRSSPSTQWYTPIGDRIEIGGGSRASSGMGLGLRAPGSSIGYETRPFSYSATWCRVCGLNGHVSYFCPSLNWETDKSMEVCEHCGRKGHQGSNCPIIHPEFTVFPTLTPTPIDPSSSGPSSAREHETLGGRLCSRCRYL